MPPLDAVGRKEQAFEAMLNEFDRAKSWLEGRGVNISSGRFYTYKKTIEGSLSRGRFNSPDVFDSEVLWAIAELHDLLEIYEFLKDVDHDLIKGALRWLKKGSVLLEDEPNDGGGIHGRNFTFELYTAARFLRAKLDVRYCSDADVNVFLNDTMLHVECKRAVTENNLEELIEKAVSQINNACDENPSDRGLIALSLSKLFWMVQESLNQGHVAEEKELQARLEPVSQAIAEALRAKYSKKSDKVLGIIFHYKVPFYRKSNGFPAFINRFSFVTFSEPETFNREISDNLSTHFKTSMYRNG